MDSYQRGDLRFDVVDSGPTGNSTVVLLHGFPQSAACWSAVTPRLVDAGFRVLAPDQRGYSPGARPSGRGSYRLNLLAGDVIALLDAAGVDRAHVVGHDWGGGVAWALAMWHPDRLATVTSLATPHPATFRTASQLLYGWHMLAFRIPAIAEWILRSRLLTRTLTGSGLSPDHARSYAERLAAPGALTAALNWYRAMPLLPRRESARKITTPALYVWGPRDRFLGRHAAELTRQWVTGPYRFEEIPGAGHWLPEEHADSVAPLILDHIRAT